MISSQIHLGSVSIPAAALVQAFGIILALLFSRHTAPRLDLDPDKIWDLGVFAVLTALIGSRIALIALNWSDFRAHPLWMIGLVGVRSVPAQAIGIALALIAAAAFIWRTNLPWRRTLDSLAPPAALADLCFCLAARFHPHPSASIVNCVAKSLLLALVLILLSFRSRKIQTVLRDSDIAALWLFLTGFAGFMYETWRPLITQPLVFSSISATQIATFLMVLAAAAIALSAPKAPIQ